MLKKVLTHILAVTIGLIIGQKTMTYAYNMDNLENFIVENSAVMYYNGCMSGTFMSVGQSNHVFCYDMAKQTYTDVRDIIKNEMWNKKYE